MDIPVNYRVRASVNKYKKAWQVRILRTESKTVGYSFKQATHCPARGQVQCLGICVGRAWLYKGKSGRKDMNIPVR